MTTVSGGGGRGTRATHGCRLLPSPSPLAGCPPGSGENDLRKVFEEHGEVEEVRIMLTQRLPYPYPYPPPFPRPLPLRHPFPFLNPNPNSLTLTLPKIFIMRGGSRSGMVRGLGIGEEVRAQGSGLAGQGQGSGLGSGCQGLGR